MIEQNKRPDQDDKRNLDTSGYNFNSPAAADRPQAARDSYNQDSSQSSASGLTGDAFTNQSNVTDSTKSEIENSGPVTDDLGNTEGLDASFRPSSPFQVDSLGNVESSGKTVFDNVNQSPDRVGTINSVEENLPNESSENSTEPSITTSSAFSDSSASSNLNSTHFSTGEADPQKKKSHKNFWSGALGGLIAAVLVSACFLGVNYFWGRNNTAGTTTVYSNNGGVSPQEILNRSGTSLSNPNWEAVARATGDAVVSITVSSKNSSGAGSGAVIDPDGYIITNNHVIADAETIEVTLLDGSTVPAEVVGTDPTTDLAVIKIDIERKLSAVSLDAGSELVVGQPVMAIGNPLGYANSVSTGIVSALDRPIAATSEDSSDSESVVTNAIQIDAAVNPGNSGGPLFDGNGKVVGITSAIATTSASGGSVGIGFAIPATLARNVAEQLMKNGKVVHAQVGVMIIDGSASIDGVEKRGAEISSFSENGKAKDSGLKEKDLIVAIDGKPVINTYAFMGAIHTYLPDQSVTVTVVRDGKLLDIKVELTEATTPSSETTNTPNPEYPNGGGDGTNSGGGGFFDPFWEWFYGRR